MFERDITTSSGKTDIDLVSENGDLIESKSDFSSVSSSNRDHNRLARKISAMSKYRSENSISGEIEIHFETQPSSDVKSLLSRKDVVCNVRTDSGLSPC